VWFIGYTPSVVASVWFGYDSPRAITANASGGRLAAPAWAMFYLNGWRERSSSKAWNPPGSLVLRRIDSYNGALANEWCPVTRNEWFKPGTEPTQFCQEHEAPLLDQLERLGRKLGRVLKGILEDL
jgi:penicillin-binding protein 1A